VNERFGMTLSSDDFDTIGGFIFGTLGRVPKTGDAIFVDGSGELRVEGAEERRVTAVRLVPARRRKTRPGDLTNETGDETNAEELEENE
jgi:Mg2+/Co2+ transporter CorC